ncbi:hypothetical protein QE152_g18998 [Popillia japonica]|uniref:Uncharacterized protein n=1 Tax=Popillia japonica TaxID=7064 RepID=A0AAW1L1Y4_POPJA
MSILMIIQKHWFILVLNNVSKCLKQMKNVDPHDHPKTLTNNDHNLQLINSLTGLPSETYGIKTATKQKATMGETTKNRRNKKLKPITIIDCNSNVSGINRCDQMVFVLFNDVQASTNSGAPTTNNFPKKNSKKRRDFFFCAVMQLKV